MKTQEAIKILTLHNNWRRGDDTYPMQDPKLIGIAIDVILDQLTKTTDQFERLIKAIEPFKYWRDISECDCSNPLPQGGCLRCDLEKILETMNSKTD